MANPEHVEIVKQGAEAIKKWQAENPGMKLELAEADLQGVNLDGVALFGADLSKAQMTHASLRKATLNNAKLSGAQLGMANLCAAYLGETNLSDATLIAADFSEAKMRKANLAGAELGLANLSRADLTEANLYRTSLREVQGAEHAKGLETVKFIPMNNLQAVATGADALYFEACRRLWPERWLDWERLRVVGRLPLFGVSYTGLILIPIIFYVLALYNDKIELVRAWADQIVALPDSPLYRFAPLVLGRLHPRSIPSLSFVLLVSTILLAAGSTLYTFFCPSRIKEFSRDQWCDQLGRSLLHYWPLAWKHRYIRLACAACYGLGGLGAAWVLLCWTKRTQPGWVKTGTKALNSDCHHAHNCVAWSMALPPLWHRCWAHRNQTGCLGASVVTSQNPRKYWLVDHVDRQQVDTSFSKV